MKKFRIGYFADGPWSHLAFEKLIEDSSIEIAFIVPRTDTTDSTLLEYARTYSIDYITPIKINSEEFYLSALEYNCDLFVSMSFNQIFRKRMIELPRLNTINCHAGKLPFYRGRNILNWALINDEKEFGITVHYIDEGIDTGDIILQRCFPITDEDDYATLLKVSHKACADILFDAIKHIQNGDSQRIKQETIHPVGFYC
jgi:methionyl-tRNA formyltransferase